MSIIEAMAAGRPVVCTAVGGVPDLVRPGTGVLVTPADDAAFAGAVSALLADPVRRTALGAAAREAVYPAYDAARLISDMTRLYDSLV